MRRYETGRKGRRISAVPRYCSPERYWKRDGQRGKGDRLNCDAGTLLFFESDFEGWRQIRVCSFSLARLKVLYRISFFSSFFSLVRSS